MFSGSLRYLTKEGFRNVWVNRLMSIASVCVLMSCLIMIGIAFLCFVNVQSLLDEVDDQNVVMIFVDNDLEQEKIAQIGDSIEAMSNISSVKYHTAAENSQDFYDKIKSDLLVDYFDDKEAETIPASFEVHLDNMELFDQTLEEIKTLENIQYVRESRELATFLVTLRRSVSYISIGAVALLLLVSLFIISNTVRMTMHSRRLEISIMKNVGATNSFIRWPFMVEGMVLGAFSGIVSLGIVFGLYQLILTSLSGALSQLQLINPVPFSKYWYWILIGFEAIGIFTGGFGSAISIKKYLKEKDYDEVLED
ncbi:MAG: permease-like cell division protein FtsX [Oscillospiraceae bacterium]|nr:permease-like cell division protein FtsX [Oscillospiraceae bacterium]